jgi:hypothetical protein
MGVQKGFQLVKLLDPAVQLNISGGITYTGEYNALTSYSIGDAVSYNGSSYVAMGDTTGNLPTDTNYWQLLAEKGEAGTNGTNGTNGEDGVSIVSILKTNTVGLIDTYTITYSDSSTSTFDVTNGAQGDKGDKGDPGDPAPSDHTLLSNIGDNTHAEIDTHIASGELHEATGFDRPIVPSISFNNATREFTITGPFTYYYAGQLVVKGVDEVVSIDDVAGLWFIYYDANGILTASQTVWSIFNTVQVATIYWNGSEGMIGDERHGLKMDRSTHDYLHRTIGTRYASGLAGSFTDTTFSIGTGQYYDEDISHEISSPVTQCRVFYRNATKWNWTAGQTKYYHELLNILQYDNAGTLTNVSEANHIAMWIYATNHVDYPIIAIMGQRQDVTLNDARANNTPDTLSFTDPPFVEMKLLYRVIIKRNGTSENYIETQDYRSVSNVQAGNVVLTDHNTLTNRSAANAHPASSIQTSVTNFNNNLSAADDTVQKALDTLDNISIPTQYTDEMAQDAVGSILDDGTIGMIIFSYDDDGNTISASVQQAELDHGSIGGLSDDDHTQYLLLGGRTGTQEITDDIKITGSLELGLDTEIFGTREDGVVTPKIKVTNQYDTLLYDRAGVMVDNQQDGIGIEVRNRAAGWGIAVRNESTSRGMTIVNTGAGSGGVFQNSGASAGNALEVRADATGTDGTGLQLQDKTDGTSQANLGQIDHYGDGYALDISNKVDAGTPIVIHQYSQKANNPAAWIDNCGDQPAIRVWNTNNDTAAPGQLGTGNFLEFKKRPIANDPLIDVIIVNNDGDIDTIGDITADGNISGANLSGTNTGDEVVATGAEVDTGTDNDKMVTPKALKDSGYLSSMSDVTDASDTVAGKVELAIATEVTTGSDTSRAITPDALAGSNIFGVKSVHMQIVADATDVDTTSGVAYFNVPQAMNGMNLIRAIAFVTTAGTTNATTVQVRNMTKYASNDALSSAISIASGATNGTAGTVNTSYDDVATNDLVKVYVTGQSTTKPKGLRVVLEYQLP